MSDPETNLSAIAKRSGINTLRLTQIGQRAFDDMIKGQYEPSSTVFARMKRIANSMREFDDPFELLCRDFLETRINILDHQIEAAEVVFDQMELRAILADEVGLGKTIEAGIIAKELQARGMAESILVIAPKTLIPQWQDEFHEKFDIELQPAGTPTEAPPTWIANLRSWYSERSPVKDDILAQEWDLVIIDEAHHLKNIKSKMYQTISPKSRDAPALRNRYMLLLTATPLQNSLQELYSLLHLVRPGALGSYPEFRHRYFADDKGQAIEHNRAAELQRLVAQNLIRRRRIDCGIDYKDRNPTAHHLEFPAPHQELYDAIFTIELDARQRGLTKVQWLRQAASSTETLRQSLQQIARGPKYDPLWKAISAIEEKGEPKLVELERILLTEPVKETGKLVVFTEYRATQTAICRHLAARGHVVHPLHGGMTVDQRRKSVLAFRDQGGIFVSTKAGAEGLNLQFASVLVNFDLPWNPMAVEQRIGRIHRLGQKRKVHVHTLAYAGTIEDFILSTLYRKLRLFELSVGEIDELFTGAANDDDDFELEAHIASLVSKNASLNNIRENLAQIAERAERARRSSTSTSTLSKKVLG